MGFVALQSCTATALAIPPPDATIPHLRARGETTRRYRKTDPPAIESKIGDLKAYYVVIIAMLGVIVVISIAYFWWVKKSDEDRGRRS